VYRTCLFCHSDLGSNEVVERFPIGRRLAFDARRGRLWVVCRSCAQWNLTPIEERWEAIEDCERMFRGTRLRVSTDQIGLARVREGLELVRIGDALRPELAAWRYGDQFGRRRRRALAWSALGIAAIGATTALPYAGLLAIVTTALGNSGYRIYAERKTRARLRLPGSNRVIRLREQELRETMIWATGDGWQLHFSYLRGSSEDRATLSGDDAIRAARAILPAINEDGGTARTVQRAVRRLESSLDANDLLRSSIAHPKLPADRGVALYAQLSVDTRLALEMAVHEETERRAFEGELAMLEDAWREAEEIAAIADGMFVPEELAVRVGALKEPEPNR
jgi:hypothetical protein